MRPGNTGLSGRLQADHLYCGNRPALRSLSTEASPNGQRDRQPESGIIVDTISALNDLYDPKSCVVSIRQVGN